MFEDLLPFWKVKTYALVGESGTGKSFRAKLVAQKYRILFIIDDGLLIKDNRILAGHSAKREKTFMAAVKTSLFDDKTQRDEVARKLQAEQFKKILVLGTSEKMVNKIAARLQLPNPSRIIHIEDISTQEEIERAIRTRKIEGKHIIPVPSMEIKRDYPHIFYDAIKILKRRSITETLIPAPQAHEKSLVRPEYSKRRKIIISKEALSQMVIHSIGEYNENIRIKKVNVKDDKAGYRVVITTDIPYDLQLGDVQKIQRHVIDDIEYYTGILIEEVHVIIDKITEEA